MKFTILFTSVFFLSIFFCRAQVAINTDGTAPGTSAMLDVKSTTKGILVPRMTATERAAIVSPAEGLLVYQTTAPVGYYYFNGANWKQMIDAVSATTNPPTNDLLTFDGTNWVARNLISGAAGSGAQIPNMQPYLAMNYCIALTGIFPSQSGIDQYIGEVDLFGFYFAPVGWAQCNGQLMSISQYTALFALIGTYYGGNGTNTFALPDLRGRVPINQGTGPGLTNRIIGEHSGSETITLSVSQLPAHTHPVTFL